MVADILNIQRLWHALRATNATKTLLQKITRWILYLCSFLRLRYHEYRRKGRPRPPPPPSSFQMADDSCMQKIISQGDKCMSFTTDMSLPNKNCDELHSDHDVISLSDATIAFSQHPYFSFSFTESAPHIRNITRAFSVSDPAIPMHLLDTNVATRRPRSQSLIGPHSDLNRSNTNLSQGLEVSTSCPRAFWPAYSVVHPLPPVEGPAGEPKKLVITLREHSKKFIPLIPSYHERHYRDVRMPKTESLAIDLEPLQTRFSQEDPDDWTSYLHPEGVLYFCNAEKRIYTDANLYDENTLAFMNECINEIDCFLDTNSIVLPPMADLVLDIVDMQVHYYFAEHRSRTVFYLDKLSTSDFSSWHEVQGASSISHFAHLMEAEYWWHIFLFPTSITLEETAVNELFDAVVHQAGDTITSDYSTSTYSKEDILNLLEIANSLKENVGTLHGGSICFLSRFMWAFTHSRFLHWHGQPSVRLSRAASAHGPIKRMRPKLMRIATILLFGAPNEHLHKLKSIWVDRLMYEHRWEEMCNKLNNEWQLYILFSTVLLNVNVAFLAIQTIDQTNHPYRSPEQISSYLSLIGSMGSIILSLLLFRIVQVKYKDNAEGVWAFLSIRAHPKYGLELLAIAYSLPFGLLVWSVIAFLVAIAWMCLDDANASTRALTGLASFVVACLVGFCVWIGWEPDQIEELPDSTASIRSKKFLNLNWFKMLSLPRLRAARVPRRSTNQATTTTV